MFDLLEEEFYSSGMLPYTSSPEKDMFMFKFIVTYFVLLKQFSLKSLEDLTTYDFVNLGHIQYQNWQLGKFEIELLDVFYRIIRAKWIDNALDDDATVLVKSPCGNFIALTGKFFINNMGRPELEVDNTIHNDIINNNLQLHFPAIRQRRTRSSSTSSSGISVNRLRNSNMIKEQVYEKCLLQQWTGLDVNECCPGGRGRGIIASRDFAKNEILIDYHARQISKDEKEEIAASERSNYLFCAPNGLFWDGSAEVCVCHPQSRILGRLVNFAASGTWNCNAKPQLFEFKPQKPASVFHAVILVAARDIAVSEEIRFDYGDKNCLELFR